MTVKESLNRVEFIDTNAELEEKLGRCIHRAKWQQKDEDARADKLCEMEKNDAMSLGITRNEFYKHVSIVCSFFDFLWFASYPITFSCS